MRPPHASTDPLDFFGAIRDLVEQSIPREEINKYATPRHQRRGEGFPVVRSIGTSPSGLVAELRAENGFLVKRVAELENALRRAQGVSPQQVRVET